MSGQPLNKSEQLALATAYPRPRLGQREVKVLQTAEEFTPAVPANWSPAPTAQDEALDQLAAAAAAQAAKNSASVVVAVYDFATDGGAISTIPLGVSLPAGAIIQSIVQEIAIAPTSADSLGTIRLNVATEGNLTASAITANGAATSAKDASATAFTRLAATRVLNAVVATTALTAGRVRWYVSYVDGSSATT
jgi:hypothetical protein